MCAQVVVVAVRCLTSNTHARIAGVSDRTCVTVIACTDCIAPVECRLCGATCGACVSWCSLAVSYTDSAYHASCVDSVATGTVEACIGSATQCVVTVHCAVTAIADLTSGDSFIGTRSRDADDGLTRFYWASGEVIARDRIVATWDSSGKWSVVGG